jgi:hypothetical protein
MGVLKFPKLGLLRLWGPITLCPNLWLRWYCKQSCSPHQELFNGMSHVTLTQGNWVDSWLLVVGSQTANLTPDPSFGHNLCFKCPNGSCEPILDIYVLITFQWYKELLNPLSFGPSFTLWTFRSPPGFQLPRWKLPWECEGSFPHTFFHSWASSFGPQPCKPLLWSWTQG